MTIREAFSIGMNVAIKDGMNNRYRAEEAQAMAEAFEARVARHRSPEKRKELMLAYCEGSAKGATVRG